jgi:hypothetical protein
MTADYFVAFLLTSSALLCLAPGTSICVPFGLEVVVAAGGVSDVELFTPAVLLLVCDVGTTGG